MESTNLSVSFDEEEAFVENDTSTYRNSVKPRVGKN